MALASSMSLEDGLKASHLLADLGTWLQQAGHIIDKTLDLLLNLPQNNHPCQ